MEQNHCGPEYAACWQHVSWELGKDDVTVAVQRAQQAASDAVELQCSGAYLSSCASGLAVAPEGEVAGRRLGVSWFLLPPKPDELLKNPCRLQDSAGAAGWLMYECIPLCWLQTVLSGRKWMNGDHNQCWDWTGGSVAASPWPERQLSVNVAVTHSSA